MRHHVAEVGARAFLSAVPATRRAAGVGSVGGVFGSAPTRGGLRIGSPATGLRAASSVVRGWQNAGTKGTHVRWTGQAAPVGAQLGLRNALHSPPLPSLRRYPEVSYPLLALQRRWKGDLSRSDAHSTKSSTPKPTEEAKSAASKPSAQESGHYHHYLTSHLPHLHRPTKEELLSLATGFWHRLHLRFKWLTIRSARPFNSEEIFAFLSWILWGHFLWLVIGTTTFVSLGIWAINTVFAQETLAGWVGEYLTRSSGVQCVFESAIVPTWRDGVITFNNVFLSRRPRGEKKGGKKRGRSVSKGSSITAAAAAAEAASLSKDSSSSNSSSSPTDAAEGDDDGNYTQFDVTIQTVNVTLSFTKWFNGHGLLRNVEVRGVRGELDRTHLLPETSAEPIDPKSYRHEHHVGDFEIEGFRMEDVLLTVHQPNDFRPFTVSVFSCELPRLRKQWLFYDFLCANHMSGSFDDSLFTVHPRQVHPLELDPTLSPGEGQWKKHSRLRIDGLKIDHLNRGVEGPFSWIQQGNVDIVADVMIPEDEDEGSIKKVVSDFYERVEGAVSQGMEGQGPRIRVGEDSVIRHDRGVEAPGGDDQTVRDARAPASFRAHADDAPSPASSETDRRFLVMDLRVHLNDVRASVPLFTKDLSYVNNALTRPIISYINSRHTFIPITCRIVKTQAEFDGSWTVFDSGLLDDLSREIYEAFVRDMFDEGRQRRRMKKVGLWGLQVAAQALFIGLAGQLA